MNRHSRVLPFPQGRGKDKEKVSQNASGGRPSVNSIASSSKGVAKSGIKGVKGLVSSLSASAKINIKEKHASHSCAPSISATVAATDRNTNTNGASSQSKISAIQDASKDLPHSATTQNGESPTNPSNNGTIKAPGEGVPVIDVTSLENVQNNHAASSGNDTSEASLPGKQSEECGASEDECNIENIGATEVNNDICSCADTESGELCASCKENQANRLKENQALFIAVVNKNKVHESIQEDLQLRLLRPDDVPEVKALCGDWFPVEYPDSWYTDITCDKRFHSLAAVINDKIVGLLVSEVKARARLHREDSTILSSAFPSITQVAYILSLGVVSTFRRLGIATALLTNLLNYLNTHDKLNVKAVYLHVLASNTNAIHFYEKYNFRRHEYLPYYYAIRGKGKDGLSYVLYINGGQPPWTLIDYMKLVGAYISRMQPSSLPSAMANRTRNFLASRRSWLPSFPSLPSMPSMPSMPSVNLPSMNMNILARLRGQQGSSHDPEVGLSPEEVAALQVDDGDELGPGRNRSWLPSVNYYGLLQRFGGQCYDSGEQPDFEDIEAGPPRL